MSDMVKYDRRKVSRMVDIVKIHQAPKGVTYEENKNAGSSASGGSAA